MFEYQLGDQFFSVEEIQSAASQSNMSLEDYITRAGITKTKKPQTLPEETEEIKKAKEVKSIGLDLYKVTEEQEEELRNSFSANADKIFVPKNQFEKKIVGINNRGQAITKTIEPEGYSDYIKRAKNKLGEKDVTEDDIFSAAKQMYIEDNLQKEFSKRVEQAIKYDEVTAIERPKVLGLSEQGFRPFPTTATPRQQSETAAFQQEQLEAAETLKEAAKKDIDIVSKNLEVYVKQIEKISDQQQQIISASYFTDEEVQKAVIKNRNLELQKKALANSYVDSYDKLIDKAQELQDEELLIDVLKRSYNPVVNLPVKTVASAASLAAGILSLPQWLVDVTTVKINDQKVSLAGGIAGEKFAEYVTNPAVKGLKEIEDSLRGMVEKPISVNEIKSLKDVGSWTADLVGNQLPILASLYFYPQAGLQAISAAAGGVKYNEMIKDEYTSGKEYTNLELFMAPTLVALAEYGSEYITAGQLSRVKNLVSTSEDVLQSARQYVTGVIQKQGAALDMVAEGGSESLATLSENIVDVAILGKDKNIWEGVDNAFVSGAFMSGVIYKAPYYGAKLIAPFMDKTTQAKLGGNLAMMDAIIQETIKEDIDPEIKSQLEDQFKILLENNNMLLSKKFKEIDELDFDGLGKERKQEILDIESRRYQVNAQFSKIIADENIDSNKKNELTEPLRQEFEELSIRKDEIFKSAKREKTFDLNNPYENLSDQEVETLIEQDIQKANGIVSDLGLKDKVEIMPVSNQQEIVENLEKLDADQESIEKARMQQNVGMLYISDKDGKNYIFVNKSNAKKRKKVDPVRHELLHALLRTSFNLNDDLQKLAGRQLFEFINAFITKDKKLQETSFGERFMRYYDLYKEGNYDEGKMMEEVFPMLSDAMARGDIQYNSTLLQKIGDFSRQSLQRIGASEISFEKPSDIFKFVLDYNENYKNSSFGKAFKSFALNGISGRVKITPSNVDTIFDDLDNQKKLNDQIDDLVGPKDENGKYTVTRDQWMREGLGKAYDILVIDNKIDALIARGFVGQVYGQPIQNFIHDVKYNAPGGSSLTEILLKFDPEKNDSLIGFINSQLKFARMKVAEQYKIELANKTNFTPELERKLAFEMEDGDSDIVQNEVERQSKLIDVSDLIPNSEQEFQSKVGELDILGMYFKSVPNLVSKSLSELLGVKENKILNPQDNLSTQELSNIQDFVFKNIDTIIKVMPLAYVKESASIEFMDRSTGVPTGLLNLMYKKVDGKWEKNNEISKEEILSGFGINADGTKVENLSPRSIEGQRAKAIVNLIGKLATNIKLRKHAKELNLSQQQILDIKSGKSSVMYDLDENRSRRADRNEHQAVVDTLFFFEKEIDNLYLNGNVSVEDGIKLLIKKGLNEKQALDLHNALNKYQPRENKKRLKDGGFTKSFMSSIDYIHYNYERSVKEQLGLVGVNISESLGGDKKFRQKIISEFFDKMFELNKTDGLSAVDEVFYFGKEKGGLDLMRFIYHHFYREAGEVHQIGKEKIYLDKKTVPSVFDSKQSFVKFFNEKAINQFSPIHMYQAKINIDGQVEIILKEKFVKDKNTSEFSTIFDLKDKRYDPRAGQMHYVDEFHNGSRTEQDLISAYKDSEYKAREDIKNFIALIDLIKERKINRGLYKNEEIFNKEAVAGVLINMLYNNSGSLNYMYKIRGIVKNENAPRKIERSTAALYYKLKKDVPTSTYANMISLFLTDKNFSYSDVLAAMEGFTAAYIPSSEIKMQPTPEELNAIQEERKRNIKAEAKVNEERFSGKQNAFTEAQAQHESKLNRIEDRVSLIVSSLGPTKKTVTKEGVEKIVAAIPVGSEQEFSRTAADIIYEKNKKTVLGKTLNKYFIDPQIADYDSLITALLRDGVIGESDKEFFFETLKRPYIEANLKLEKISLQTRERFSNLRKQKQSLFEILDDDSGVLDLSNEDLIKIYFYNKAGYEIPGISQQEVDYALSALRDKKALFGLAKDILNMYPATNAIWSKPDAYWKNRPVSQEISNAVQKEVRAEVFADWVELKNRAFSQNNINKIRALYGKKFSDALVDVLDRMETNRIRSARLADWENNLINWTRGSVSNVMFWNGRSAGLQLISMFNYIDALENNPYQAALSIKDGKQLAQDVRLIWNSDYIKSRRGGMQTDIEQAELQRLSEDPGGTILSLYRKFLRKGFTLTQIGDSLAITIGGSVYLGTMRRKYNTLIDSLPLDFAYSVRTGKQPTYNQKIIDTVYDKIYVKNSTGERYVDVKGKIIDDKGYAVEPRVFFKNEKFKTIYEKKDRQQNQELFDKLIEELAFVDFYEKTEESQQSARPDRLSVEQTSTWGRLILAFQNTPMQYNRIILKAISDLKNNRGSKYNNLSRIAYYGFVQNLFFSTLQNGLLAVAYNGYDNEEDEKLQETKMDKINNALVGSMQTLLRGLGIKGSIGYTVGLFAYNLLKLSKDDAKYYDVSRAVVDLTAFSPALNIKLRTAKNVFDDFYFSGKQDYELHKRMFKKALSEKDIRSKIRYGLYNPAFDTATDLLMLGFNSPTNRMLKKARNISEGLRQQEYILNNFLFLAGWDGWSLGVDYKELEKQKEVVKEIKKYESSKKRRKLSF